jgi:hypothetical protein
LTYYLNQSFNTTLAFCTTAHLGVPFLVSAGMVRLLINNNITNYHYDNSKQIEYSLTKLSLFCALAWDPLYQGQKNNPVHSIGATTLSVKALSITTFSLLASECGVQHEGPSVYVMLSVALILLF